MFFPQPQTSIEQLDRISMSQRSSAISWSMFVSKSNQFHESLQILFEIYSLNNQFLDHFDLPCLIIHAESSIFCRLLVAQSRHFVIMDRLYFDNNRTTSATTKTECFISMFCNFAPDYDFIWTIHLSRHGPWEHLIRSGAATSRSCMMELVNPISKWTLYILYILYVCIYIYIWDIVVYTWYYIIPHRIHGAGIY